MTVSTAEVEPGPAAQDALSARFGSWYYALHPHYRVALRWLLILISAVVAFYPSLVSLVHTTTSGGIGGYVWTVWLVGAPVAAVVALRTRNELPIHDRQTDMIVGIMGFVLALLIQSVLTPRFAMYFHLLRLDLVALTLFVLSACVVLFGLRPVARFGWVWALLFMVFSLPYYLLVTVMGGGRGAAGAATLLISSFGAAIAVGRTFARAAVGFCAAWVVGAAALFVLGTVYRGGPMRLFQGLPAVISIGVVLGALAYLARRNNGAPIPALRRKTEPLAAKQVWSAVPLVIAVAAVLAFIPLPVQADTSVIQRAAPGALTFGQPVIAPPGWQTEARRNFREVSRLYGNDAVLVRQQMTAESGDPRFDKLSRPRTVMVDSVVSQRPTSFNVFPARAVYDMTGARISPLHDVDLGYGVTGQILSVVDDNLLITWNALRFDWGDSKLAQRITIFGVDNHEPDAPFPQPAGTTMSTLRTLFTLLFRGNAVLDEQTPTFKDQELLTEFGRGLVAAQFAPSGEAG